MSLEIIHQLKTPAFVINEQYLKEDVEEVLELSIASKARCLYSLKALAVRNVLEVIATRLSGFSASSLFEAKLARSVLGNTGLVHLVCPAIKKGDLGQAAQVINRITFNSINQLDLSYYLNDTDVEIGLRINPEMSFVKDDRYNPCKKMSKLGEQVAEARQFLESDQPVLKYLSGLHIHTNCESKNFEELDATIKKLTRVFGETLHKIKWINLGGGYLINLIEKKRVFVECVNYLRKEFNLEVLFEPGSGVVRRACQLVGTIVDKLVRNGQELLILDTCVNHLPQVFEYQYKHDILGNTDKGKYEYLICGSSCLAGDTFGTYRFDVELNIGDRIIFPDAGDYSLVKSHMFNGINLPTIYWLSKNNQLKVIRKYRYKDFLSQYGGLDVIN